MTALATAAGPVITEPGVYQLTATEYHSDPVPGGSLSSSGARKLLPPSCPALYQWALTHPVHSDAFDLGHAAHKLVLGAGEDIVHIDADSYRTRDAREARDAAHAAGKIPMLPDQFQLVSRMAHAAKRHPLVKALLAPGAGRPEQALFWPDPEFGVWRRALIDWLPEPAEGRRMIIVDYKTTRCASNESFSRDAMDYGYHQQAAWYLDAVDALNLSLDAAFLFMVQEKNPPYLVNVIELDPVAIRIGRALNRRALTVFAECQRTGEWPGYSNDVEHVSLPAWYESRLLEEIGAMR